MIYPKIPLAQTVVQLCKAKALEHVVISPGSRNAPLIIGFTNDPYFKCYSIVDERCAAFFALGIAQQTKKPVVLVCTSGSALLNYYPAISEAYYSDIPLVVLSADRPKHLIGIGDGQTINQKNVYDNHILYSANLKLDLKDEKNIPGNEDLPIIKNLESKLERFLGLQKDIQEHNEHEINTAIHFAFLKKGPVHINVPFDEPLYETVEKLTVTPEVKKVNKQNNTPDESLLRDCYDDWMSASRKMILVGVNPPNAIEKKWLHELAEDHSVIVFTETTSNLHHKSFFPSIDQIISPLDEQELAALKPDILLTFGGQVISKRIKAFLRKYKPNAHWHIDEKTANDTFFCLTNHIECSPQVFFEAFLPKITHYKKSDYGDFWTNIKLKRLKKHEQYLKEIPFCDFTVFNAILETVPSNSVLHVSNSSAIRYTQLFSLNKTIDVYCNRGTSGIDGSTSTAIGFATVTEKRTTLITGDLSFFYDSNALWNNYIPETFRIIIVNNNGGGIFRILPGHDDTKNFNMFFETQHQLTAEQLSNMFGFKYYAANNEAQLQDALANFYDAEGGQPKILEVFTPTALNDKILLQYFNYIK